MPVPDIDYKIKTAGGKDLLLHLNEVEANFIPPLAERIDIAAYAKKLADKSVTFEAWRDRFLAGVIAVYYNPSEQTAFITNVSVSKKFMGAGIASALLNQCISYSKGNNITQIKLEVNKHNLPAITFYRKFNFLDESTKEDSLFMKLEI